MTEENKEQRTMNETRYTINPAALKIKCPKGWQETKDGTGFERFTAEGQTITINSYDDGHEYSVKIGMGGKSIPKFYSTFRKSLSVANGLAKTAFCGGWME